jgi:hypothetical protein
MAKKVSKTVQEYRKQRKRIQSTISRLRKKGYFPAINILPDIPKKITQGSVRRLQKIDIEYIYKKSVYVDIETGELLEGKKPKSKRKKQTQNKTGQQKNKTGQQKERYADFTDMVIREYINQISRFPKKVAEIVLRKLDEAIKKSGKDNVAYALQYKNEHLSEYLNNVALFGDSIQAILAYCDAMFGDLPGMDDESRLEISEIIDSESYSE